MFFKIAGGLFLAITLQVSSCSNGSNGTQSVVMTSTSASPSGGSTTPPASPTPTATATAIPPAVYFAAYNPTTTAGTFAMLAPSELDNEFLANGLTDVSATYQTNTANTIQNTGVTSPPDIATTASFVNSSLVVGFIEGTSNGFTLESRRSGSTYISTTFSSTGGTWSDTNGAGATFTPYTFATPLTAGTQYYAKWDTATTGGTTQLTLTIYTPAGAIVDQETTTDSVSASQGLSGPDYVNETSDTTDSAGITSIQAYNGVQTAAAVANPATPIPAVTPAPSATQSTVFLLNADFACGTSPRGSLANPTNTSPPLNTNASATFNGHVPVIVYLSEVPGATSGSAYTQPSCPSTWLGVQYMIRFDSYADYLAQKSIIPSWVWWVQYDSEPGVSPTTAPSELPSPNGNPTNIPAQYYGSFSQLAGTGTNGAGAGTPAPQYFQASGEWSQLTSAEKTALKSTSVAYGTYGGYGWLSLYVQSQNSTATVPTWISNWTPEMNAVVGVNPSILAFLGVSQNLTGPGALPNYYGTQAQMENVIEARPPNVVGIALSCSAVSPVAIAYAQCAQAIADTAGVVPASAPTPFPSLSPLPFPTGSPSTPVPSATPTATMTPTPPPSPAAAVATTAPFHFASGSAHSITFSAPTATTFNVGDLLIYSPTYGSGNGPGSAPSGWTEVSGCSGNSNGGIANDVFTHVITSGDAGAYTWAGISGVSSGILFDVTNATFVTAVQTTGTASSVGAVSGATATAGALDETIAFFGVLGGTTANNISPRTATSPFTSPVVTQAATSNATFAMSSGASGSLTPAGTLGGSPNSYYTGAYTECTVVAHVPSDPTPSPSPTAAVAIATPWSANNGSTTPRPFTLTGAGTQVTVIASYLGSANPLGGTIATLLNSWALESGKTDGSATTGAAVDAHSYDAGNIGVCTKRCRRII